MSCPISEIMHLLLMTYSQAGNILLDHLMTFSSKIARWCIIDSIIVIISICDIRSPEKLYYQFVDHHLHQSVCKMYSILLESRLTTKAYNEEAGQSTKTYGQQLIGLLQNDRKILYISPHSDCIGQKEY